MIKTKRQYLFIIIALIIILFATIIISTVLGTAKISILDSLKILLSKIPLLKNFINIENINASSIKIIIDIRLTRILIAGLVGMGLAVCGAVYQSILKNGMADPYILGVSSGAALGATIAIITGEFISTKILRIYICCSYYNASVYNIKTYI